MFVHGISFVAIVVEVMGREAVVGWLEGDQWMAPAVQALAKRFLLVESERDAALAECERWRSAAEMAGVRADETKR